MDFKFNIGDKVRICPHAKSDNVHGINFAASMEKYKGKEFIITNRFIRDSFPLYYLSADKDDLIRWIWVEEWLEPVNCITISFDPSDRAAAHKAVEEAIKEFYTPKDWTEEEISSAKNLMKDMIQEVFMSGGDVAFDDACQENTIVCVVRPDCFSLDDSCGRSAPHGKDIYNIWIGKCVALCKALHRPIPDFIRLKNT